MEMRCLRLTTFPYFFFSHSLTPSFSHRRKRLAHVVSPQYVRFPGRDCLWTYENDTEIIYRQIPARQKVPINYGRVDGILKYGFKSDRSRKPADELTRR